MCASLAACGGLLEGNAASGPDAASLDAPGLAPGYTDAAPAPFDASALPGCAPCLAIACEDLYAQCTQSAACYAAYQCALARGGDGQACLCAAPASAVGPYRALARCLEQAACDGSCGPLCASSDASVAGALRCGALRLAPACGDGSKAPVARSSTETCDACVAGGCGSVAAACDAGTDCQLYLACLATCTEPACATACGAAHVEGQSAALGLDVCLGALCAEDCSF